MFTPDTLAMLSAYGVTVDLMAILNDPSSVPSVLDSLVEAFHAAEDAYKAHKDANSENGVTPSAQLSRELSHTPLDPEVVEDAQSMVSDWQSVDYDTRAPIPERVAYCTLILSLLRGMMETITERRDLLVNEYAAQTRQSTVSDVVDHAANMRTIRDSLLTPIATLAGQPDYAKTHNLSLPRGRQAGSTSEVDGGAFKGSHLFVEVEHVPGRWTPRAAVLGYIPGHSLRTLVKAIHDSGAKFWEGFDWVTVGKLEDGRPVRVRGILVKD